VIAWIQLFLCDRILQVSYADGLSAIIQLAFGVPQGSVLGPLLFLLYTAEHFYIIAEARLISHSYADDTQLYISAPASSASTTVQQFVACVEATDAWMGTNRLQMNADKTQLTWLGTKEQHDKLSITELSLLYAKVTFSSTVFDLGFLLDSELTTKDRVFGTVSVLLLAATSTPTCQVVVDV